MSGSTTQIDSGVSFSPALLGIGDAARMLGVSRTTVQKMVDSGALQAVRTSGGHRRILRSSLERHLTERLPSRAGSDEKRLHVLIPEDNPLMRQTYEQRISRWGLPIELSLCTDAVDALLLIERKRPHVIITDLRMEPFDGFHLLRVLRAQPTFSSQSIVVVSSMAPKEIEAKGGLPPSVCLYGKPPPWDRLRGFLEACAQRELGVTTYSGLAVPESQEMSMVAEDSAELQSKSLFLSDDSGETPADPSLGEKGALFF